MNKIINICMETTKRTYWGNAGAGCIFYCTSTDRVLLSHRSEHVYEPNTWGVWGGKLEPGETPKKAAQRELKEETGYSGTYDLKLAYVYTDGDFRYTTYVAVVADEFTPKLDWENEGYKWCDLDDLPGNLHFGLSEALPNIKQVISDLHKS